MEQKNCKTIFSPRVARYLLKEGNTIVDIKADKTNKDKTLFIFNVTDKFKSDLEYISTHKQENFITEA